MPKITPGIRKRRGMYGVTLNAWNTLSYADIPCVLVLK